MHGNSSRFLVYLKQQPLNKFLLHRVLKDNFYDRSPDCDGNSNLQGIQNTVQHLIICLFVST